MQLSARPGGRYFAVSCLLIAIWLFHAELSVGQTGNSRAQLYFFTNPACGPCRAVEPELEQLYLEGYPIMKVDTSIHVDWTQRFQVSSTPTVILVAGNQILGRKSGYIDAATLRQWFAASDAPRSPQPAVESQAPQAKLPASLSSAYGVDDPTRLQGTPHPVNEAERNALNATVRLKIDDPHGSSYATGTIVHAHGNEALVLTCGHVFRDSKGRGAITVEYGFLENQPASTAGELLHYDSEQRDIGLVAITTHRPLQPVAVAGANFPVDKQSPIFSIGCDHGERPTIRRSQVKNQAKYDGILKYEIFGRPVNGRSGGGMFAADGRLVGVCNAAVVDADEGVYVALDTIHWQFEQVNLAHLFGSHENDNSKIAHSINSNSPTSAIASRPTAAAQTLPTAPRQLDQLPVRHLQADSLVDFKPRQVPTNAAATNPVSLNQPEPETELIVVLRDKNSSAAVSSWVVENPSEEIIAILRATQPSRSPAESRSNSLAQLRQEMPILQNVENAGSKSYNHSQIRAQSPY